MIGTTDRGQSPDRILYGIDWSNIKWREMITAGWREC